jgi:hypothetical protein
MAEELTAGQIHLSNVTADASGVLRTGERASVPLGTMEFRNLQSGPDGALLVIPTEPNSLGDELILSAVSLGAGGELKVAVAPPVPAARALVVGMDGSLTITDTPGGVVFYIPGAAMKYAVEATAKPKKQPRSWPLPLVR